MANVSIKPAATGSYQHRYNPLTVGSIDFGDLVSSRTIEVEKSDNWNEVEVRGTLRMLPQVFPAYGKNTLKSAAFFVPSSQIVEYYDQFRNNKAVWKGKAVRLPRFHAGDINKMFHQQNNLRSVVVSDASFSAAKNYCLSNNKKWDFIYLASDDNWYFCKLTFAGKKLFKVFKMLGYDFASYKYSGDWTDLTSLRASVTWNVDALPLLAYLKVYVDYFMNANMYNTNILVSFLQHIHDDENFSSGGFTYNNGYIDDVTLYNCLMEVLVPFEHNMYLDAFNTPNSPLGVDPSSEMIKLNGDSPLSPVVPEYNIPGYNVKQTIDVDRDSVNLISEEVGTQFTVGSLSQLGLNTLGAIYQYVRRNNLFGSKPIQEIFARFGIKDSDWNTHFAHKLYEGESEIDYSAVVSQTDNYDSVTDSGKTLGAYAGFGVSGLNFKFQYNAADHGYLLILHWIQITPIQMRGFDPAVLRVDPFDFYTPEFDGKTIRAIPYAEVSVDPGICLGQTGDLSIFGFTDIYEDYRHMRDNVFGDFITDDNGANNFMFARDLSFWRCGISPRDGDFSDPGTSGVIKPQLNYVQYMNRLGLTRDCTDPFQSEAYNGDRYYLLINFKISASRHISSKSAALDLNGEGDMQMQLGGTQIQ